MIQGSIARRYARALIEVAGADFERVGEELAAVADVLSTSRELSLLIADPSTPRETRKKLLETIVVSGKLAQATSNFLRLLDDRRRLLQLPDISRAYRGLADEKAGRVRALVSTAQPMPADMQAKLQTALTTATKKNVTVNTAVDPKLLGGVVAQVGNVVYDGSLRTQLEAMRRELLERA